MKKPTLKQLRTKLKTVNRMRNIVLNQIDDHKTKNELPKLKKQYQGKYFKYRNCYDSERTWWLYSYVKEVVDMAGFNGFQFQTDTYDKIDIEFNNDQSFSSLRKEITKDEFMKALSKIKKELDKWT